MTKKPYIRCLGVLAACWLGLAVPAGAGEPLSFGALLGPRADAVLRSTVPAAIDIAQKACKATADSCGLQPVKVADLPESVRGLLEATFPPAVVEQANLYFDMPLNDPEMGIGFLNTLGMIAAGGGTVMGMTFGNDVYLACAKADLLKSAEARSLVGHELVHVAQYQGLGFSKYKELYAKETATKSSYEDNVLEQEAFRFQDRFMHHRDRAFFAFYRSEDRPETVCTPANAGGAALDDLAGLEAVPVEITAADETLTRRVTLVLGSSDPATGLVAAQLLDPHGREPLFVFDTPGPVRLAWNRRIAPDGPVVTAVFGEPGTEAVWRDAKGFHCHRFAGRVRFQDVDSNGSVEAVQLDAAGRDVACWRWTGAGFER